MKFEEYMKTKIKRGVILDGELVKNCIYASESEGVIRRYIVDHHGKFIINRDVIETETVCGDVKIIEEISY